MNPWTSVATFRLLTCNHALLGHLGGWYRHRTFRGAIRRGPGGQRSRRGLYQSSLTHHQELSFGSVPVSPVSLSLLSWVGGARAT